MWLCQTVAGEQQQFDTKCHPTFQIRDLEDSLDNLASIQPFLESLTFSQENIFLIHGEPVVIVDQEVVKTRSIDHYSNIMMDVCFRSNLLAYEPSPRDLFLLTQTLEKRGIKEIMMIGVLIAGEMVYRNSKGYSFFSSMKPTNPREQSIFPIAVKTGELISRIIPDKIDFSSYKFSLCTDSPAGTLTQIISLYENIQSFSPNYENLINESIVQLQSLINKTRIDIVNQKNNCRTSFLETELIFPSLVNLESVFQKMNNKFPDLSLT